MAFLTVKNTKVELQLAGVWTDITSRVRLGDGITITRGRADEGSQTDPSSCTLTLDNRDGRFSPRNPTGPYYGVIGRNTPLRVSVLPLGDVTRLTAAEETRGFISTPDSAGLSITGDIDLRYEASLPTWSAALAFVTKYPSVGQLSYRLTSDATGKLMLEWSTDGTAELFATSTIPLPTMHGRQAVRATLDVDNGAGGRTITFYTAASIAGPWTALGTPVVQPSTTSIFDSPAPLRMGASPGWNVYAAEVRQGIGGTVRANPIFTTQADGATSFVDGAGNTWSTDADSVLSKRRRRFHGEVSSWPTQWGTDERNIRTPVTAAGILRRLGQGAAPLQSALRRGIPSEAGVVAYWPMEDEDGSTHAASALPGAPPMNIAGTPQLASSERVAGSKALPVLAGAVFSGAVPVASSGTIQFRWVMAIPAAGEADFSEIIRIHTTSSATPRWDVFYTTAAGGTFRIVAYDNDGVFAAGGGPATTHTGVNGRRYQASLELTTSGANTAWQFTTLDIDTDGALGQSGTVAGTVGRAASATVNPNAELLETAVGHVHVRSAVATNPYGLENYARGWVPETPGRRIERLCSEEDVPFVAYGYLGPVSGDSGGVGAFQGMGPQQADQGFLDLIGQAVEVDLGILLEPRDAAVLAYRPRETLYSQAPALELDYAELGQLDPVDDDQSIRNDITVTRDRGSSARQQLTSGPLSVQPPPAGVGIYDDQVDLNLATDAQLEQQASWRLHLGTIDEARYPSISMRLAHPRFQADPVLTAAVLDLDQGDLLTVVNPPAWVPPEAIRQIAQGFTEVITETGLDIDVNCTPASPWGVGVYDSGDPLARYDTAGCELAEALDATETDIDVTTADGPVWTQDPAEYPFDIVIGGERITAGGCTGATAAQTFTGCTRSVNGVVKAHSSGAAVQLADPVYYGL